ncbi:hypothetical protein CTI12_AA527470 [Artemisia annua]|uniref:KIB1-4 beta-propeller domain-containing protein n=1 Tax=Artemisia annua TaxID=35608 RepID=A0A2U1L5P4_ARTAN|nr:hypothetical protein CTI12_AA527470 [Artemisia annua]
MEEISKGSVCDRLPSLSSKYSWFISQSLQADEHNTRDLFFCTIHDELPHYRCQIPELLEKRVRGCSFGWVILSSHPLNNKWSLWNPLTSNIITLPTLILEDGQYESTGHCCLSAPPDDPTSILLLTRTDKSTFVFSRLDKKRKKFRWSQMSYARQLKRLTYNGKLVHSLTSCNGKVYALSTDAGFGTFVIHVDIVVQDNEVLIKLMLLSECPYPSSGHGGDDMIHYLKGSCTELFYIGIYLDEETIRTEKTPVDVLMYKSDMTCIDWEKRECLKKWDVTDYDFDVYHDHKELDMSVEIWEQVDDLKDTNFFVDLGRDHSVSYSRVIGAELGGFIHIRGEMGDIIYSYHVNNDTVSLLHTPSPMLPSSHVSMWEYMFEDDPREAKCVDSEGEMENNDEMLSRPVKHNGVESNEPHLLNIPFNLLETIMEHCVGVEYMNVRATCKQCHLAAPLIKWSNETSLRRLKRYSVVSPWFVVLNRKQGIITFTDPMLGENYHMKNSQISIVDYRIRCSRFGWLLLENNETQCLVFYNPFTNDLRKLPEMEYNTPQSLCFSAPPTSVDCMVVGITTEWYAYIHFVNQEPSWCEFALDYDPHSIYRLTFYGQHLYALRKEGELIVFSNMGKEDYSCKVVVAEGPKRCSGSSIENYLTKYDQHLLLVSVDERGRHIKVFKMNSVKQEWEKIEGVGKHMIYICGTTCLCTEAKMPQMENKIFFPRMLTNNRNIVFYSLETCKYHVFDGENTKEYLGDFVGTTSQFSPHAWIEPSWS